MTISTMSPAVWRVLDRLQERDYRVRRSGGGYSFPCPAHDDHNPSANLTEGAEGKAVIHCFAGCPPEAIVSAIGLRMADLFVAEISSPPPRQTRRVVARYPYRDAEGTVRYEVLRYEPKEFRQRQPDGSGGWIWNIKGIGRLPFRLPELLTSSPTEPIWVPEGEKDVEVLVRLGFAASTNSGGAGKFGHDLVPWFEGRNVVIVCDQDAAGWTHGFRLAHQLEPVAQSVRIVDILPDAKDVAELAIRIRNQGGNDEDVRRLLNALADRDPGMLDDWTPVPCPSA